MGKLICADCLKYVPALKQPCECGSLRIVLESVVVSLFGKTYRETFKGKSLSIPYK